MRIRFSFVAKFVLFFQVSLKIFGYIYSIFYHQTNIFTTGIDNIINGNPGDIQATLAAGQLGLLSLKCLRRIFVRSFQELTSVESALVRTQKRFG